MRDASVLLRDSIHAMNAFDPSIYQRTEAPCVSIYLPTPHDEREMRRDRWVSTQFKDLRNEAERTLAETYDKAAYKGIVEKMDYLLDHPDDTIWLSAQHGLALLIDNNDAFAFDLTFAPQPTVMVGEEFYLKPLLMNAEYEMDYYLLLLNVGNFGLLRGNHDHAHWVELPDDVKQAFIELYPLQEPDDKPTDIGALDYYSLEGHMSPFHGHRSRNDVTKEHREKFFRYVDKVLNDRILRDDPTPVILVTLPEHESAFRALATFPTLLPETILKDPCTVSGTELRDAAVAIIEKRRTDAIGALKERYDLDASKDRASDDPVKIGRALFEKDVDVLFVEQGKGLPGTFDAATGTVDYDPATDPIDNKELDPANPDIADAFAQATLKQGGKVIVLPADDMPTTSGVAAIYRYAEPSVTG